MQTTLRRNVIPAIALSAVAAWLIVGLPAMTPSADAAPAEPATYRGTVTYYGEPADERVLVTAHVGTRIVATTTVTTTQPGDPAYELIVAADDDVVLLEHAVAMYRALPEGQFAVLPGTSHLLAHEVPDALVATLTRFLGEPIAERAMPMGGV